MQAISYLQNFCHRMQSTLWLGALLCVSPAVFSQSAQELSPDELQDPQQASVRRLVNYFEANLNTLGDPDIPALDNDVLVTESYKKLFRDENVQIEDDLITHRSTVTYKDAPSYLLDADFFFRSAKFEYVIQDITSQSAESGEESWLVQTVRTLWGIDLNGDTIQNDLERFIEINRTTDGLKIASIYTTKLNRNEANRLWWSGLSPEWRTWLSDKASLVDDLLLANVRSYDESLLLSSKDTFLLPGYRNSTNRIDSNHIIFYGDTIFTVGKVSLDLPAEAIDAFLEGLLAMRELNLENKSLPDLQPLAPLKSLKSLNIAGTNIQDISPLRNLSQLEELNISRTSIQDLMPLRFARNMRRLISRQSNLQGEIPEWTELENVDVSESSLSPNWIAGIKSELLYLDISNTGITNLDGFTNTGKLEYLDISNTQIANIQPLSKAFMLRVLLAANTPLRSLQVLSGLNNLERINIDGTRVDRLDDLSGKENLQRIFCDGSEISESAALEFHRRNPQVLVIHESAYLLTWWKQLPPSWQTVFSQQANFVGDPDKENLTTISSLRKLNLSGIELEESLLPLAELPELEQLNLSGTRFQNFDILAQLVFLRDLNLNNTAVSDISMLSGHSGLGIIRLENTLVSNLDPLTSCSRLEIVYADKSALSDSAWMSFEKVRPDVLVVFQSAERAAWWSGLDPSWQELFSATADFTGYPTPTDLAQIRLIEELQLSQKDLTDLSPLAYLSRLRILRCNGNGISSLLPLRKISKLEVVEVSGNPLYSFEGLENHGKLKSLIADNTPIKNLDPLARLLLLEKLSVAGTEIKNLQPLVLHRRLVYLDCSNTRVRSLSPIEEMTTLRDLIIYNTDLSSNRVSSFQSSHPDCKINFY